MSGPVLLSSWICFRCCCCWCWCCFYSAVAWTLQQRWLLEKDSTSSEGRKTRSGKPQTKGKKKKKMKKKREEEKRLENMRKGFNGAVALLSRKKKKWGQCEEGIQWISCLDVAQQENGQIMRKGRNGGGAFLSCTGSTYGNHQRVESRQKNWHHHRALCSLETKKKGSMHDTRESERESTFLTRRECGKGLWRTNGGTVGCQWVMRR